MNGCHGNWGVASGLWGIWLLFQGSSSGVEVGWGRGEIWGVKVFMSQALWSEHCFWLHKHSTVQCFIVPGSSEDFSQLNSGSWEFQYEFVWKMKVCRTGNRHTNLTTFSCLKCPSSSVEPVNMCSVFGSNWNMVYNEGQSSDLQFDSHSSFSLNLKSLPVYSLFFHYTKVVFQTEMCEFVNLLTSASLVVKGYFWRTMGGTWWLVNFNWTWKMKALRP